MLSRRQFNPPHKSFWQRKSLCQNDIGHESQKAVSIWWPKIPAQVVIDVRAEHCLLPIFPGHSGAGENVHRGQKHSSEERNVSCGLQIFFETDFPKSMHGGGAPLYQNSIFFPKNLTSLFELSRLVHLHDLIVRIAFEKCQLSEKKFCWDTFA